MFKTLSLHVFDYRPIASRRDDGKTEVVYIRSFYHDRVNLAGLEISDLPLSRTVVNCGAPEQSSDCAQFSALHDELPEENVIIAAVLDNRYDSNEIRNIFSADCIEPVISGRSNRTNVIVFDRTKYKARNRIERYFNKLKQFRRIATRYEKHAFTFLAAIHIFEAFIAILN